jgi:hypothetical protein
MVTIDTYELSANYVRPITTTTVWVYDPLGVLEENFLQQNFFERRGSISLREPSMRS